MNETKIKKEKKYSLEIKIDELKKEREELGKKLKEQRNKLNEVNGLSDGIFKAKLFSEDFHNDECEKENKKTLDLIKRDNLDFLPNFYTYKQKNRDRLLYFL